MPNTKTSLTWRLRLAAVFMLTMPFTIYAQPAGSSAANHQDGKLLTWRATPPEPELPSRQSFTGRGVTVGVLDFDFGDNPAHQALDGVWQLVGPFSGRDVEDHGVFVSRIIAGRDMHDGLGQGMAHGSRVIALDADVKPFYSHRKLAERGVRIINHSYGILDYDEMLEGTVAEQLQNHERILKENNLYRAVLRGGALLIWPTGNDGAPGPGLPASAPVFSPELEKGWIAVTWLGVDGTLHPDANACGHASDWCISALGSYPMRDGTVLEGTSFSAPVVAAVAALVSEAYPWMNNSELRQTLLSTADPIDDPDIDPIDHPDIYGWGKVNPDRAVRGPALFDWRLEHGDSFVVDFDSYRSHFFNDIGGDRGLVKSGSGTLVLWGKNTYAGATDIWSGVLELYGSVTGAVYIRRHGALLSNGGVIGGSVSNENLLLVSGAGLHIKRRLDTKGAKLQIQLGSTITVDDFAFIHGARLEVSNPDPRYVMTLRETVLRAREIKGQFASMAASPLFTVSPIYTATQVDLDIKRNDVHAVALEHFEGARAKQAAAKAIESSFRAMDQHWQETPEVECLFDRKPQSAQTRVSSAFVEKAAALQHLETLQELGNALEGLTGEAYASSLALNFQQAQAINRSLSNRVDALSRARELSGLWVSMLGADGKLRQPGYASANTKMFGAQLGVDQRLSADTIVGAALSSSDASASFDGLGGRSKGQAVGVALYGRHGAPTGNYLSGRIGHDWTNTKVSRVIAIDRSERIDSSRHDGMTSLYAELGHVFEIGDANYAPFVGAEYNLLRRGAFAETGSEFALQADSATYKQAAALLGMRYQSGPVNWIAGTTTLTGSGAYRYSNPADLSFTAAFKGAPDVAFTLQGIGLQRHSGWVGLGASTCMNSIDLNWFINLDMQIDGHGVNNKAISAGLRYEFG